MWGVIDDINRRLLNFLQMYLFLSACYCLCVINTGLPQLPCHFEMDYKLTLSLDSTHYSITQATNKLKFLAMDQAWHFSHTHLHMKICLYLCFLEAAQNKSQINWFYTTILSGVLFNERVWRASHLIHGTSLYCQTSYMILRIRYLGSIMDLWWFPSPEWTTFVMKGYLADSLKWSIWDRPLFLCLNAVCRYFL